MNELTPVELAVLKNTCEIILSRLQFDRDSSIYVFAGDLTFDAVTGKCFYQICNKLLTDKKQEVNPTDDL